MNTVVMITGLVMRSPGFWTFLEARMGEGVCRTGILTAFRVAVARPPAVGRKRADEHLAGMLANEATREADPSDPLDLIAQAESAAEAAGMPRSAVHRAVRESRRDPGGSR